LSQLDGELFDDSHDVFLAKNKELFAIDFYGLAGIFAEQDFLADFDTDSSDAAIVEELAVTDCKDFTLIRFFASVVRDHNAGGSFALLIQALNDHAIVQWTQFHQISPGGLFSTDDPDGVTFVMTFGGTHHTESNPRRT
jgi:hypothetical protein